MSPTLDASTAYWGEQAKGKEFLTRRAAEEPCDGTPHHSAIRWAERGLGVVRALFCEHRCSMVPLAPQCNVSYTGKRDERCRSSP